MDAKVQVPVNAYFARAPPIRALEQLLMRTVDGHDLHFHIRVKKPDGTYEEAHRRSHISTHSPRPATR